MPTVILLDVSLSMSRRIVSNDGSQTDLQLRHLAVQGIHQFLDEMSERCKLEFTALLAFSSLWEIVVPFTRDFSALKAGCLNVDVYDKTCIENALGGVETLVMDEWGCIAPINLILVTDGRVGTGKGSLKESLNKTASAENRFPLPFSFPCNLSVVCVTDNAMDQNLSDNISCYRRLININKQIGDIYIPESPLNVKSVEQCFHRIILAHYDSYEGTLFSGNLKSDITLSPTPNFKNCWMNILHSYKPQNEDFSTLKMPTELKIIGFLDIADISNPPHVSRHVVMPIPKISQSTGVNGKRLNSQSCSEEDGKTPCFCVLLHGSLKIEKMVALIQLGPDWQGMLYSWSDSRKKSALMLSVFEPGLSISWLGEMKNLGPSTELSINPYQYDQKEDAEETPFPVAPNKRRSYHLQPNVVWVKNAGLQSDIQKVMRYAKKLPEKHSAFFKIRIICNLTGLWVDAWADVQVSRLLLLNFVLDPFLYTLSRKQCRDIVKGWLCCCCSKGSKRSLLSRLFYLKRKKRGSTLSSGQTGSGSNTHTMIIPISLVKTGSKSGTPAQSNENSIADVVIHSSGKEDSSATKSDHAPNTGIENNQDCSRTAEISPGDMKSDEKLLQRHYSTSAMEAKAHRKEVTKSLPDLKEAGEENKNEEIQVDVAYMYDLAFQKQAIDQQENSSL